MRRKELKHIIFLFAFIVLLSGCSTDKSIPSVTSSIKKIVTPEPYTMALQEIKEQNLDKALRYLDLVIKDFPDNEEYVYRAYFLKTVIYTDYYTADLAVVNALLEGTKDNPFLKSDEKKKMIECVQSILDKIDTYKQPFLESVTYVYDNYENNKDLEFSFYYPHMEYNTESINDIEWYRKSGTPIPGEEQINSALSDAKIYCLGTSLDEVIKKNNVNYPAFFYATGGVTMEWDKELAKKIAQKIIDITKDEKYNKYRLDAEEALKTFEK